MKVIKAIFTIVRYILMIVLICLLAIILTQRISNNKMALAGLRIFTVVTESMVPEYVVGDAILVKSVAPEELQVGDDITYLGEKDTFADKIITHRIIKKEKGEDGRYTLVTKGIANEKEDPTITDAQVYGKVCYKIKSISYINGIIGNLYGMYFIIVVPMAVMMFFEFMGYKSDKEEEAELVESEKEKNGSEALEETDERREKRKKKRNKRREKRRIKNQK